MISLSRDKYFRLALLSLLERQGSNNLPLSRASFGGNVMDKQLSKDTAELSKTGLSLGLMARILACFIAALMVPYCVFASPQVDDNTRLSQVEKVIFGKAKSEGNIQTRLEAVERVVLGKKKHGAVNKRLDAIVRLVPTQDSTQFMPPVAPSRDNSFTDPVLSPSTQVERGHVQVSDEQNEQINSHLRTGMQRFSQDDLRGAETEFQQVLNIDPNNPHAFFNLGVVAERRGDLNLALLNFRTALVFDPKASDLQQAVADMERRLSWQKRGESGTRNLNAFGLSAEQTMNAQQPILPQSASIRSKSSLPMVTVSQNSRETSQKLGRAAFTVARVVGSGVLSVFSGRAGGLDIGCPVCRLLRGGF